MKTRKICYIITGGITISACIIILGVYLTWPDQDADENSSDNDPNDIPLNFTNALIVQLNYSALWALDLDSENSMFVMQNWSNYHHTFDFYMKKTIYFGSSIVGKPITSLSNVFPELNQPGKWYSEKIAVDYLNEKIYVIDGWAAKINIFDMMGEYYNIVLSDLSEPKDIALDPVEGFMFILGISLILKTNMVGALPEVIVDRTGMSTFALDRKGKKVFWATLVKIESADYQGNNSQIVTNISNVVSSLAVLKNRLFWLNPSSGIEKSILWSCVIVSGNCKGVSKQIFIDNAVAVKAYNFNRLNIPNPCKQSSNNCEHMCILTSKREYKCACTLGWELKDDFKSCKPVDDFLLYVQGNFVKGRTLDFSKDILVGAILPIKLDIASLVQKKKIDFDYDARKHMFIFTDDWDINKIDINPSSEQVTIGGEVGFDLIPAIDWVSKNLYYARATRWDGKSHIVVRGIDTFSTFNDEKIIFKLEENQRPKSLVLHPNLGYIFFTVLDISSNKSKIFRINSNGSGLVYYEKNLAVSINETGLCIDYADHRLYWFSEDTAKIYHATLNGSDPRTIDVSMIKHPKSINVYEKWIYISNRTSVWRLHKESGGDAIKIIPTFDDDSQIIYGAKIFSQNMQTVDEDHPCGVNNGGCQRYCFAVPDTAETSTFKGKLDKVCGCNDNEELQTDGKSCAESPLPSRTKMMYDKHSNSIKSNQL